MTQEVKLKRSQCNYRAENARFLLECDFSKQYSNYYRKRLEKTRPFLEFNARCKWDQSIPLYGLADLASVPSVDLDYLDHHLVSPKSLSPKESPQNTSNASTHEYSKRFRGSSESTSTSSPYPNTSTQRSENSKQKFNNELLQSPIFPPTKGQQSSRINIESPETLNQMRQVVEDEQSKDCIVIGTIFKRMKLQPDVIEELSRGDYHVKCERYAGHYTSPDDNLVLEDIDETICLIGRINPKEFVTGVIVALFGVPINDGSQFLVKDICYAEPNRLILYNETLSESYLEASLERPLKLVDTDPIYLMLVSGLGFHQNMDKGSHLIKAMQEMIDFIWGGGNYSNDERSSRVVRVLVLGDNLSGSRLFEDESTCSQSSDDLVKRMKQSRQVKPYSGSIQAVKHMDDFFAQLSKTIDVDVMPGPSDPSSHLLPQQPFHPCMFPKSCMFPTFNCTTNPHHAIYNDNVEILATSGQNIDIIDKFSALSDPIEIMKRHLMWGNSAPSAPDNLYSVPYEDEDPYVIDFIPDIYVAGCQDTYKTQWYDYTAVEQKASQTKEEFDDNDGDGDDLQDSNEVLFRPPKIISKPTPSSQQHLERQQSDSACYSADSSTKISNISSSSSTTPAPQAPFWDAKKSKTLLVTVPKFCQTFTCVLINLRSLESHSLKFK